jgi:hypothetical protein
VAVLNVKVAGPPLAAAAFDDVTVPSAATLKVNRPE